MFINKFYANIISTSLLIIAIAIIYFVFGLFGLQLAVPPSQAGSVWPPAGIALASVLLYGPKVLPGIFIGSVCITAWAFGFDNYSVVIYLITGAGATLFPYCGSYLIKKFAGYPGDLIDDREIVLFLLLGGPVSCLISSTIGITAMTVYGVITPSEIPLNWFSWWVGDTIGVLIFTPIILTLFTPGSPLWKRRRYSLGLPLIASFCFVLFFFFHVLSLEEKRNQQYFSDHASAVTNSILNSFNYRSRFLLAIQHFYVNSDEIKKDDFIRFTQSFIKGTNKNLNFSFIEYKKDISPSSFKIKYSVHNEKFDAVLQDIPVSTIKMIITDTVNKELPSIYLYYSKDVVNLITPVYNHKKPIPLQGFIVISGPLTQLISDSLLKTKAKGLKLIINSATDGQLIYTSKDINSVHSKLSHSISIVNQDWQFTYFLNTNHLYSKTHWSMWWVLISGLLFTSLLGFGLMVLTGRYLRTEQIVGNRTSELLIAKNAAESANTAKNHFLSNISHELRTPLNGILGFTQLLKKRSYMTEGDVKHLNIISHCGDHLLTMINEILDISKIESKKIKLEPESFDFNKLLENIISIFSLKAEQKQLKFKVSKPTALPNVYNDSNRINQIICNVIGNAIKFTSTGSIKLDITHQDEILTVVVTDTGCGISLADQQNIFKPFKQIDNDNFSNEGIGLGLAICKELTQLLKGSISVTSSVNKGSSFTISIPLPFSTIQSTTSLNTIQAKPVVHPIKPSVLIADDNEINLMLLGFMLENLKCTVDSAENGEQALELIDKKHYDIALIDLNMPVLNGFEFVKTIRNRNITMPVIAISAYADEHKIKQAISLGFNDYMTKPLNQDQLDILIKQYV